jgi:drug/metabolite transporter (DMT)-like permease
LLIFCFIPPSTIAFHRPNSHIHSMTVALAYIILCVVWGVTYLAIKVGLEGFDPYFMGGVRFLLAGILFIPVFFRKSVTLPKDLKTWFWVILPGLFMLTGANGLVTYAEVFVDSGLAALTVSTGPAWAAIIGGFFFSKSEKFDRWSMFGVALAMLGIYVLHHDRLNLEHAEWPGVIALIVAPILWTTGSLLQKKHVKQFDMLAVSALQFFAGSIAFFIISALRGESWQIETTPRVLGWVVFLIVIGTNLTYTAYAFVLKKMPASRAVTYAYINPVIALIAGHLILDEVIGPEVYPATALILGGLLIIYFMRSRTTIT